LVVWLENPILVKDIQNFIIILLVGNLFNTFLYIPMQVVLAFGSPSYGAIMGFVSALITMISMLYFVPIYGLLGAVCVWSTVRFSIFVVAPYFIFRKFLVGQNFEWYVKDVIIPFLIILVTISGAKSLLSYFGTMSIYAEGFLAITLMTLTFIIGIIFSSRLRRYAIINARILIKRISLYEKN
jgi:O-antigen/teichoic acid export membrane protein